MQEISDRIAILLRHEGLTRQEFADALGIHVKSVQNYVRGKTVPDTRVLQSLHREFGVSPNWVVLGRGEMILKGEGVSVGEGQQLLAIIGLLNQKRKQIARDFIRLIERLQRMDRMEVWMQQALGRGSLPLSYFQETWRIEDAEWEVLEKFLRFERAKLRAEPEEPRRRGRAEWSPEMKKLFEEARKEAEKARKGLETKLQSLQALWEDVPELDDVEFPYIGVEEED